MAHIFDVTSSPEKDAALDTNGKGEVTFTVTNKTNAPMKVSAVLGPKSSPVMSWVKMAGDAERTIEANKSDRFVVNIQVPPGTKTGNYSFRLDAISVARPDEDSTEGPTIGIPVTLEPPKPKPFPWWILVAALIVVGIACYAALKLIPGGDLEVPDLTHRKLADAEALLIKNQLKLGNVANVAAEPSNVDLIVSQSPAAHAKAAAGSAIDVQVGASNQVDVPDLSQKNLADADTLLTSQHLKLGNIDYLIRDASQIDLIQNQTPKPPAKLAPDSKVDVQVGAAIVTVPPLNSTLPDALKALSAAHLDQGNITAINRPGAKPGQVLDSRPKSGDQAQSHTKVELTIQAGTVDVPNLNGQILATLPAVLANSNLTLGTVTGQPNRIVAIQGLRIDIQPNTVADWGPKGTVPVGTPINVVFPGGYKIVPKNVVNSMVTNKVQFLGGH